MHSHISKADPSAVPALGLATGLAEGIWRPQQPVFTCHPFHDLATSFPIPLGIPCTRYVCRWLTTHRWKSRSSLPIRWPAGRAAGRGSPQHFTTLDTTGHAGNRAGLPNCPGSSGKLPWASFPYREDTRSPIYMQTFCTHATQSKVSQTSSFTIQAKISHTVQNEMAWPSGNREKQCCHVQNSP